MKELIKIEKDEAEINQLSPLTWAYVGDSVYEMYIRTYLSNTTNLNPHKLHVLSIKYVKANAQATILKELNLTDEEKEIVRRGRNTVNHHLPKHATAEDYMYSTAFEALIASLNFWFSLQSFCVFSKIMTFSSLPIFLHHWNF